MKKILITIVLIAYCAIGKSQINDKSRVVSLWAVKEKTKNVNGVSLGILELTGYNDDSITVQPKKVNGARLELVGLGLLLPLIPHSPISDSLKIQMEYRKGETPAPMNINGLNISGSGSVCSCLINGISTGFIGQYVYKFNGVSLSAVMNISEYFNGVQFSLFNDTYKSNGFQVGAGNSATHFNGVQLSMIGNGANKFRGVQIGLFNHAKNLKGIQLGLWNVNQKRKMPLLNWNFKS